jgi:hypothetical protein
MRWQVEHSNVRSSKPLSPGEIRPSPILCLQVGHDGRSITEMGTRTTQTPGTDPDITFSRWRRRLRKQLGTEYLTGSIIIEARFPGASTRLRPAWCLPRQAGFSFGNKRSWLELAYRVVPTVAACIASPFLPPQAPQGRLCLEEAHNG